MAEPFTPSELLKLADKATIKRMRVGRPFFLRLLATYDAIEKRHAPPEVMPAPLVSSGIPVGPEGDT